MEEALRPGKSQITGDQIAPGQIDISHLSPGFFAEIKQISLHNHSGTKSRKILMSDLDGYFTRSGFLIYSSDGTKKYRVTVDSVSNDWVLTAV